MTQGQTDYGLDLAIIGNGRTAALLEPSSRITWWCFPRFDSDPVFCRLLAGDEEKGFTDVVLDGVADNDEDMARTLFDTYYYAPDYAADGVAGMTRWLAGNGFGVTANESGSTMRLDRTAR